MIKEIDFNTIKYYWRKYLWQDYLKIKKIDLTTFDEYSYEGLRNISQKLGELILSPTYIAYIIDGEIVGTESGYKTNKDYYRIRGLWVHENYRRKGIATKLIN